jgi:AcrR family transcriptional regulator
MTDRKSPMSGVRGEALRVRVLDAAERLLREGKADFSMRDLAAEAAVSFATPFNQFGSKTSLMHALSARRIDLMIERFSQVPALPMAADRVLQAVDVAVAVMLAEPGVNRAVMGWIGTACASPGRVLDHSSALWALALGDGEGLTASRRDQALQSLPGQLAFAFRGVLSFWTAGEVRDAALASDARAMAATVMAGFIDQSPT